MHKSSARYIQKLNQNEYPTLNICIDVIFGCTLRGEDIVYAGSSDDMREV